MHVRFCAAILITLILGCAPNRSISTSIVSVSNESYRGVEYRSIVVAAPYEDLQIRSSIEDLFRRALSNRYRKI